MDEGASPPTESNRTPNAGGPERGSQSMWAKLCAREGNSPDRPLRPPSSIAEWQRMCVRPDNQDVGLEAAIHSKSA